MAPPDPKGIFWGDDEWFRKNRFSWFPDDKFKDRNWQFGTSGDERAVKLTKQITGRVSAKPEADRVGQASAVYEGQVLGDNFQPYSTVIVKIFMRIPYVSIPPNKPYPDKDDLMSRKLPLVQDLSSNKSIQYGKEYWALEHLTRLNCSSSPRHITHFQKNEANPWVQNGFLCFVIMDKVPGTRVSDIWRFDPHSTEQREKQIQIQKAFRNAMVEISRLGVGHSDEATRNILWDESKSKCYVIDFETSTYDKDFQPTCWADLEPRMPHPDALLRVWGLVTREDSNMLREIRKRVRQSPSRA